MINGVERPKSTTSVLKKAFVKGYIANEEILKEQLELILRQSDGEAKLEIEGEEEYGTGVSPEVIEPFKEFRELASKIDGGLERI